MKKRRRVVPLILLPISIGLIAVAAWLGFQQREQFNQIHAVYPQGISVAGIPIGGLNRDQAAQRIVEAYSVPVELHYEGSVIQVKPETLGFSLDLTPMLDKADATRATGPFWDAFWAYLWNHDPPAQSEDIPLQASVDENQIQAYLAHEIAPRYNQAPQAAQPVLGSVNFMPGKPGEVLQVDPAVPLIKQALLSLTDRTVSLTSSTIEPSGVSIQSLSAMLQQRMEMSSFTGITEIYFQNLRTHQELDLAYQNGKVLPPGIGFTAASTIKIAIMISVFRRISEPIPQDVLDNLVKMIEISENDPADWLMSHVIDQVRGPLIVSEDMQALGMKSTFLAGYFYLGAPLLKKFETPANQRQDYFTDPDPYNQTTPSEIGRLLGDIYQCSQDGGGPLAEVFPGQFTKSECQQMITLLFGNHMPMLAAAGTPDGIKIAHKHGWVIDPKDGLMHSICDAGIVYSPGGDYVVAIYRWDKDQILFDPANIQMADLSEVIYNYVNQTGP